MDINKIIPLAMAMHIKCTSTPKHPDRLWFHPASCTMDTIGSSTKVKRPRRQAGHLPPSGAEAENGWSPTSASLYAFMPYSGTNSLSRPKHLSDSLFLRLYVGPSNSKFCDMFSFAVISHERL